MRKLTLILTLMLSVSCFANGWDNDNPADNADFDVAMQEIRANWDAMEVVFGVDLADSRTFIDVTESAYGAEGDGTTNDAPAIVLAITAAAALTPNGAIYFPPGEYLIESSIAITSDFIALGFGQAIISAGDVDYPFSVNANVDYIRIDGITFQEFGGNVFQANATTWVVGELTFTNNVVTACDSGIWLNCKVTELIANNNRFLSLSSANSIYGIGCGTNAYADQDSMEKYIVTNNIFNSLVSSGASKEVHAVILYGREAIISNNLIDTTTNNSGDGDEAIYTKCRYATISDNVVIDGGSSTSGQGVINIKGTTRAASTSPRGHSVIVANNLLYSSNGATVDCTGINVETEDVLIKGNYVEGFGYVGINVRSVASDNIHIWNNLVVNHQGAQAILAAVKDADHVTIKGNSVHSLLGGNSTPTTVRGIQVQLSDGDAEDVVITGNDIYEDGETAASSTILGIVVDIDSGDTMTRLNISNNKVYVDDATAAEYGIVLDVAGTLTTAYVANNDCASVATYPFWTVSPENITDFIVEDNFFYGPTMALVAATNIEWYHTGTKFTNTGDDTTRTHTLPDAVIGLRYSFYATADADIRVDVDTGDQIRGTSAANDYLSLDTLGDSLIVECFVAGWWERVVEYGTLVEE